MIRTAVDEKREKKRRSVFGATVPTEMETERTKKMHRKLSEGFEVSEGRRSTDEVAGFAVSASTPASEEGPEEATDSVLKGSSRVRRREKKNRPLNSVPVEAEEEDGKEETSEQGGSVARKKKRRKKYGREEKYAEETRPIGNESNMKNDDSGCEETGTRDHTTKKKQRKKKLREERHAEELEAKDDEESGVPDDGRDKRLRHKESVRRKLTSQRLNKGLVMLSPKVEAKIYKLKKALHRKGLPPDEIKQIVRERRRAEELKFRHEEADENVCFRCRRPGHRFADCELVVRDDEQGRGVCFRCGSTEHVLRDCTARSKKGRLPYAKCFVCGLQGHISRECPSNPKGAFPRGGRCNSCGSVNHLRKDCPLLKEVDSDAVAATFMRSGQSADALDDE